MLISEIGVEMPEFHPSKQLCSRAGLAPTNNESAGKKKSVRIFKAGCYLNALLVHIESAVFENTKYPEMKNKYLNIKKRRGHKKSYYRYSLQTLNGYLSYVEKPGSLPDPSVFRYDQYPCFTRNNHRTSSEIN